MSDYRSAVDLIFRRLRELSTDNRSDFILLAACCNNPAEDFDETVDIAVEILEHLPSQVEAMDVDAPMSPSMTEWLKKIGTNVRIARENNRMSREGLAYNTRLVPEYIAGIEDGTISPSNMALQRISIETGTAMSDLYQKESQ